MYDFTRCKLCAEPAAAPTYRLKNATVYTCAACDFHSIDRLDTLPVDPATARSLDARARDFIERQLSASAARQQGKLRLVQRYCPLAGATCLDLGAGAGQFASLLAAQGATVHGIEPQPVFRAFAQEKFGLTLQAETVDAPHWQEGFAAAFDLVTLWDVLEHVNFPVATLRDAVRLLKPGGWLVLDTPRRDALFYRLGEWSYRFSRGANPLLLASFYSPLPFRHKQIFTRAQLSTLVESLGLRVLRLESPLRTLHGQMTLVCQKK